MKKLQKIFLVALPVLFMVGLIPLIQNDYLLKFFYIVLLLIIFRIKRVKGDIVVFIFGFSVMIIFETIFISTGVETFVRHSLFGLMPLWLPFLWGYGFIVIKRGIKIID